MGRWLRGMRHQACTADSRRYGQPLLEHMRTLSPVSSFHHVVIMEDQQEHYGETWWVSEDSPDIRRAEELERVKRRPEVR
jgi:hypothetical protein